MNYVTDYADFLFKPLKNNPEYIVIEIEGGFINTRLLVINGKTVVNFDTMEVSENMRNLGFGTTLIQKALTFWNVEPEDVYFSAMSDGSRALQSKFDLGKNIWS